MADLHEHTASWPTGTGRAQMAVVTRYVSGGRPATRGVVGDARATLAGGMVVGGVTTVTYLCTDDHIR